MAKPVITPHQFTAYASQISDIYVALEDLLFEQIARRLQTPKDKGKDYVLQWQIEKMQQLRMLNQETITELSKATKIAREEIVKMFEEVGVKSILSIDEIMKKSRRTKDLPNDLDLLLEAYVTQVFRELDNFVNQTLITTNYGEGTVTAMYRKIVETTTAQVLAANMTINQAVAATTIAWSQKGIATGFIDRGGRQWHLEQYAQTVLRSTVNRTYNELRLSRMQEYGVDLVVVNSYRDARPACAKIQGGIASMSNPSSNPKYPSIYEFGYGEPDGIRGINCRHILYPFIDGVNINNQEQIDETAANERYKLTQHQRYLERQVREAKRSLRLAETFDDEKAIEKYKKQVRNRQANVREFVAANDLARRYDRERVMT